ncbi:hypothetical protein SUDANB121_03501 [Nocardiopsis dassonvillei]|uniref:hypothetical protein n=1 Tax=Nocardiopsis dassonvillei TaxID=2014 RepID=UPI003F56599A
MRIVKFSLALAAAVALSLGASPALASTTQGVGEVPGRAGEAIGSLLEDRWEKLGPAGEILEGVLSDRWEK